MSTNLSAAIQLKLSWQYVSDEVLSDPDDIGNFLARISLSDGTGDNQVKKMYRAQGTIAGTATAEIDLAGSLVDVFGATINFTKIRAISIANLGVVSGSTFVPTDGHDIRIKPYSSNGWVSPFANTAANKIRLHTAGLWFAAAPRHGYLVTGGSADTLQLAGLHASGSVGFEIVLFGTV